MKRMNRFFRMLAAALLICALALPCAIAENADGPREPDLNIIVVNQDAESLSREDTEKMVKETKEAYYKNDAVGIQFQSLVGLTEEEMMNEDEEKVVVPVMTVKYGDKVMRCLCQEIGEADADGTRPLYIGLHGGGGGPSEGNDEQWMEMAQY